MPAEHPCRVGARFLAPVLLALLGSACVDEVHLLDDERARLACEEAQVLALPPSGCTTLVVESNSPYGCSEGAGIEHDGSWVRVQSDALRPATLQVQLRSTSTLCTSDAGATPCPSTLYVRVGGAAPCTCEPGTLETYPLGASTLDLPLFASDQDVLLEPLGAVFELTLCASGSLGP